MAEWDVVIVGAGSAGAALASRPSENSTRRVLLLEAGPDHTLVAKDAQPQTGCWSGLDLNRRAPSIRAGSAI